MAANTAAVPAAEQEAAPGQAALYKLACAAQNYAWGRLYEDSEVNGVHMCTSRPGSGRSEAWQGPHVATWAR